MNPRARRRAWAEQPVRVWMILSMLLLVGIIYVLVDQLPEGIAERQIIKTYKPVTAVLHDVGKMHDTTWRHTAITGGAEEDRWATMIYPGGPPEGSSRELETDRLEGKHPGDSVDIRYDPSHPDVWSDRMEPEPWGGRLLIIWMLLPALAITLLMLLRRRQLMLRIWREGEPIIATVVESRQSPIAPRSRLIRFTIDDSPDRRVHSTFFPNSAGTIEKGDQISMLALPNNPGRAIVGGLYS
jgi:hypothetical protein